MRILAFFDNGPVNNTFCQVFEHLMDQLNIN